jgi:hypothetical protein
MFLVNPQEKLPQYRAITERCNYQGLISQWKLCHLPNFFAQLSGKKSLSISLEHLFVEICGLISVKFEVNHKTLAKTKRLCL